jgi:hypothetical protein
MKGLNSHNGALEHYIAMGLSVMSSELVILIHLDLRPMNLRPD